MTRCLFTDGMEALGGRDACSLYTAVLHAMMAVYHFQVRQLVEDRVVYQRRLRHHDAPIEPDGAVVGTATREHHLVSYEDRRLGRVPEAGAESCRRPREVFHILPVGSLGFSQLGKL